MLMVCVATMDSSVMQSGMAGCDIYHRDTALRGHLSSEEGVSLLALALNMIQSLLILISLRTSQAQAAESSAWRGSAACPS